MKDKPFRPTKGKLKILEELARFEVLTTRDLALLISGDEAHSSITTLNATLGILDTKEGLVNRIYFRPEEYLGRGNLPNASGLSEKGVEEAQKRWPRTHPKEFPLTHSLHTIEHDLRRARTHMKVSALAEKHRWQLGWLKGDNDVVKPDDVFELTNTRTSHFFLETEHAKKQFGTRKGMHAKLKRYFDFYGTGKVRDEWGFRYFTVIVPMRDQDSMMNLLIHLKGSCNCIDRIRKKKHEGAPFKLVSDIIALTTYDDIIERTGELIFHTTSGKTLSFMDIVK